MQIKTKSRISVILTLIMMLWGVALNYSKQQLNCPSWPICFEVDSLRPLANTYMVYFHRFFGVVLGFFVFSLSIDLNKVKSEHLKKSIFILVFLLIQGIIGALSAVFEMPTIIKTTHLLFSLWTLGFVIYLDHLIWESEEKETPNVLFPGWIRDFFSVGLYLLATQMILGALVKQTGSGDVCGLGRDVGYLCFEKFTGERSFWPYTSSAQLHMLHRFGSTVILIINTIVGVIGVYTSKKYLKGLWEGKHLFFASLLLVLLTFLQLYSGLFSLYAKLPILVGVTHMICATLMFSIYLKLGFSLRTLEENFLGHTRPTFVSDILELAKPRLASLVMLTAIVGVLAAPGKIDYIKVFISLFLIFLVVASGTILNCYMERDLDKLMERTKDRALPAGRMKPISALVTGSLLAFVSIPALYFYINPITALLGFIAFASYLFMYTPMKLKTPFAVWVGALPGAIPPVMGYTTLMGRLDAMSWSMFLILFMWQIPHFLAISIYRSREYAQANIKVYPNTIGFDATRLKILITTIVLSIVSLLPYYIADTTKYYFYSAVLINFIFLVLAMQGYYTDETETSQNKWARNFFLASIVHQPILLLSLIFFK